MNTNKILGMLLGAAAVAYMAMPAISAPAPYVADPTAAEVTIDMNSYKYAFDPGEITVYEGQTITLNITALDRKHGFKLDAYDINAAVVPGEVTSVTFVADKAGEFPFKCSVFCGTGHLGMKGLLRVVSPQG